MSELTPLQEDERDALTGDRMAALRVVSALRKYREAVAQLLDARYRDGFADGAATSTLESRAAEIEAADT